ncbi:MAG: flagellar assembly protein FliW [Clostridia bacterium]|jgi:flagellar assembly factor FliW|nr:flagellar assembly protein FliW [Clostridia bacterium]
MILKTLRFGEIEIAEEQIIHFAWGLPGFPEQRRFVPIHSGSGDSLFFLQAVDLPDLTFILADPFHLNGNYVADIPEEDLEALQIKMPEEAAVYVILTVRQGGQEITANLVAPLVINTAKKMGRQVILFNSPYSARFPLMARQENAAKGGKAHAGLNP